MPNLPFFEVQSKYSAFTLFFSDWMSDYLWFVGQINLMGKDWNFYRSM